MSSRLLVAAVVLAACAVSGCNPAARLVGKWDADMTQVNAAMDKTKESLAQSGNPFGAFASMMIGSMSLSVEFQADGKFSFGGTFMGQSNSVPGTWRYVKSDGDALVLMIKMDNASAEKEIQVKFTDNDHFEMAPPVDEGTPMPGGQQQLTFVRAKAE